MTATTSGAPITYTCPKCGGTWRKVREWKEGIATELERCGRCAGTFLDDGEIERLIMLEIQSRERRAALKMKARKNHD